jgi:thymidylate synthase (FAD)
VICDRGVSHEFVRHRVKSFAQESTRYCNYIKAKFGGSVTCITPPWLQEHEELEFEEDLTVIEQIYFKWLKKGWTAQQARGFLSTFTKTELVMTGFVSDWEHFFTLRCHSTAHPQAREIAIPLQEQFIEKGYING